MEAQTSSSARRKQRLRKTAVAGAQHAYRSAQFAWSFSPIGLSRATNESKKKGKVRAKYLLRKTKDSERLRSSREAGILLRLPGAETCALRKGKEVVP